MLLRHRIPAGVGDGDAGLILADPLEPRLDLGVLFRRERRLAEAEHQPVRRRYLAVDAGEGHLALALAGEGEGAADPQVDLA